MSYRTFKGVLGESNLERKCRWLFGASLFTLITVSFWWFKAENDKIVYDMNRVVGRALVNSAMLDAHKSVFEKSLDRRTEVHIVKDDDLNNNIADLLRSRNFTWKTFYPKNPKELNKPHEQFEYQWIGEWESFGQTLSSDQAVIDAFKKSDNELGREMPDGNRAQYIYYEPVFAKQGCIACHAHDGTGGRLYLPDLKVGNLMAVFRVDLDTTDTQSGQKRAWALLATLGLVTGALAMLALYLIVRYVIVKPLAHLRDVSDAIRRGDVEQRAVIHTGDEFEELGAAFNRMLRQLLRQQDELRAVNGELDTKIDELAQVNMRLFELNKVKSDFLSTVSHELRTPLNSILGFSDLLANFKSLEDKQRRYAANIERSGRQLLDMINHMLDLAKLESGQMEMRPTEFDIGSVVVTQCDLARPLSEKKHIELECEIAPDLPPVWQDRGKIEQILNNLLSNAVKFTPDGGRIRVTVRRDRRGDLRMSVADTGVGISESEQALVFEKFRQGASALSGGNAMTREYSGSGLGLSIVRELCRLLGGDVTLESELGRGSEFTVILPWSVADTIDGESSAVEELRQLAGASRGADTGANI